MDLHRGSAQASGPGCLRLRSTGARCSPPFDRMAPLGCALLKLQQSAPVATLWHVPSCLAELKALEMQVPMSHSRSSDAS